VGIQGRFEEDRRIVVAGHIFPEVYWKQEVERWTGSWRGIHDPHLCVGVSPKHASRIQEIQKKRLKN
jgi:hypothetical protein